MNEQMDVAKRRKLNESANQPHHQNYLYHRQINHQNGHEDLLVSEEDDEEQYNEQQPQPHLLLDYEEEQNDFVDNYEYETNVINENENYQTMCCIKNIICNIKTNLNINLTKFTNFFGGQLTHKLPGNRLVVKINNQRYAFITYKTGFIILTNLFFLNDIEVLLDYFNSLFILCLKYGIANINDDEDDEIIDDDDEDEYEKNNDKKKKDIKQTQIKKLKVSYLIENIHYSFQIDRTIYDQRRKESFVRSLVDYIYNSLNENTNIVNENNNFVLYLQPNNNRLRRKRKKRNTISISGIKPTNQSLNSNNNNSIIEANNEETEDGMFELDDGVINNSNMCGSRRFLTATSRDVFPADILKFKFERMNNECLASFKSVASAKRNKMINFKFQNVSILMFCNGKLIITGCQTIEDVGNMCLLLTSILNFIFETPRVKN